MLRFRPSPALAVAFVALLVALGGTAYAASVVTGKNVRNGSLTGADIKDGSLGRTDVRAGAGLKLRYISTTYFQEPMTLATGDAVCPKGMFTIGGGVSGFGDDQGKSLPDEQLLNSSFLMDDTLDPKAKRDKDRIPERYVGIVYNSSPKRLNFEVDAVCAAASSVSSNFASGAAIRHVVPRGAVRATRVASHQSR